jgi:hypothetical protein
MRARRWSWTLNNPSQEDCEALANLMSTKDTLNAQGVKYVCFGEEVAPTTGCVHFQGYVEFTSLKSMNQVKEILKNQTVHLEKSKGSGYQNRTYCQKDGVFTEAGLTPKEKTSQGRRRDLEEIKDLLLDGVPEREIAERYFSQWIRYRKSFRDFAAMMNPIRMAAPSYALETFPQEWRVIAEQTFQSLIIWGQAGIGKTQFAMAVLPRALVVSHIDDLRLFDPTEHEGIIFDDMNFNHLPRSSQIHLVDWDITRSIHCRFSNATIPMHTKKIFTTNVDDGGIFDTLDAAISRRIRVCHLGTFF